MVCSLPTPSRVAYTLVCIKVGRRGVRVSVYADRFLVVLSGLRQVWGHTKGCFTMGNCFQTSGPSIVLVKSGELVEHRLWPTMSGDRHVAVREITKHNSTFSSTNISSNIIWLLQLHDIIQMKWNYTLINYNHDNLAIRSHIRICDGV